MVHTIPPSTLQQRAEQTSMGAHSAYNKARETALACVSLAYSWELTLSCPPPHRNLHPLVEWLVCASAPRSSDVARSSIVDANLQSIHSQIVKYNCIYDAGTAHVWYRMYYTRTAVCTVQYGTQLNTPTNQKAHHCKTWTKIQKQTNKQTTKQLNKQ